MPTLRRFSSTSLVIPFLFALLAAIAEPARAQTPSASPSGPPPDLDAIVARVLKTFDVPGIGLAIVKDNAVIVSKGYGVRKLGQPEKVDDQTLFGIASNTKAFTATALGLLVEEGKIKWDAPVVNYLPWFQLWDPYVTRELTVRDLLVHRSGLGLGAGDLLWWPPSTYNRKDVAERLRFIKPATSFRSAYAYDNVLYLIAGHVIEAVSGQSWEDFISTRILKKVGMTGANVRHSDASAGGGNVATPHAPLEGKVTPVKPFDSDNTNPAGGINSGSADMAKWMLVQLNAGQLADGSRLFSAATARQLTTLVTPMPFGDPPKELAAMRRNFNGYALGFNIHDYRGKKVVTHTGGLPGYVSKVTMIPDLKLGVVVLTNQESGDAFTALTWQIVDYYLGAKDTDWVSAFQAYAARRDASNAEAEKAALATRTTTSRPSLPLERYAGTYADAWYGDITIAQEADKLVMRFSKTPALVGDLEHWQYDTFIVRWRDRELRADAYVIFALDADGSIDQAKMRAVSASTDFSFDFQDLLLKPVKTPATTGGK
jgi:CubicO group peptidase (beta-lactamase class C family)